MLLPLLKIFMARKAIPAIYLFLIAFSFYAGLPALSVALMAILFLFLFLFSILLLSGRLGKILNGFWKDVFLYRLYYEQMPYRIFFGSLYLLASLAGLFFTAYLWR